MYCVVQARASQCKRKGIEHVSKTEISINSYVTDIGHKHHVGFVRDKVKHRVLIVELFLERQKAVLEKVKAVVKTLTTGDSAREFATRDTYERRLINQEAEWRYDILDMNRGKAGVLKYHGVEVALYYKREITEVMPGVGEKPPEHPLVDPEDAWQRLDLLGPSAKRANIVLKRYHTMLEEDNKLLKDEIQILKAKFENVAQKLRRYTDKEDRLKEAAEAAEAAKAAKKKKKTKTNKLDRLCMICGCYENYHEFTKGGRCKGCLGGKAKCTDCTFRPKGVRAKRLKKKKRG